MRTADRDTRYMALALRLAAKGLGATSPNPAVGAVVVAGGRIVGAGYHRKAGEPHAEVLALQAAGRRAQGATLYLTLEPCCHSRKRTPPCVPVILRSGIRRAVIAMHDPNPRVSGRGIRALQRAGIDVAVGCLSDKASALNEGYAHWVRTGRPLVILKASMTLDGKIATASGESRWITGSEARRLVHAWRSRVDAILVGLGTVLRDDPQLTARAVPNGQAARRPRQPLRIILDSRLRIPLTARVVAPAPGPSTIIATTAASSARKRRQLEARGVRVLVLPARQGLVSLPACFARLGRMGVTTVMIEGGAEVNASVLQSRMAHRLRLFVAPRLLGGQDAKSVIGGRSPRHLDRAVPLKNLRVRMVGPDLLIEGDLAD